MPLSNTKQLSPTARGVTREEKLQKVPLSQYLAGCAKRFPKALSVHQLQARQPMRAQHVVTIALLSCSLIGGPLVDPSRRGDRGV